MTRSVLAYEEFNNVKLRILHDDESDDFLIPAVQVAQALDYSEPKRAVRDLINRNKQEFDGLYYSGNLPVTYSSSEDVLLTEQGVYAFIILSKTSKSAEFRKWVYSLLQKYRKGQLKPVLSETDIRELEQVKKNYRFVSLELQQNQRDIKMLAQAVKSLQKQTNRIVTTLEADHLQKEVWLYAKRKAMKEGREYATAEEKKEAWVLLKDLLGYSKYHRFDRFTLEDYHKALEILRSLNRELDFTELKI